MRSGGARRALATAAWAAALGQATFAVDDPRRQKGTARVRVVHVPSAAPPVNVLVNGAPAFRRVTFPAITGFAFLRRAGVYIGVVPTTRGRGAAGFLRRTDGTC